MFVRTLLALTVLLLACAGSANAACRQNSNGQPCCQCAYWVSYHLFGPGHGLGNGNQVGANLKRLYGWRESATPSVGAVASFQGCFGHGIGSQYGHVGFVSSWDGNSFTLTGANQGCENHPQSWSSACRNEDGCTNVSDWYGIPLPNPEPNCVLFYTPPTAPAPPPHHAPPPPPGHGSSKVYCVSATAGLRLRACAGTGCNVEATIPFGTRVIDDGHPTQSANGYIWRHVQYGSRTGWAATEFLKICSPAHAFTNVTGLVSDPSSSSNGDNVEAWVVVLSLLGGILGGVLIVAAVAFFIRYRAQEHQQKTSSQLSRESTQSILAQHVSEPPAGYRNTLFTPDA